MKKISLLSLLSVLAISTAVSAHTENPFFAPAEGKGYSITSVEMGDQYKGVEDSTLTIKEKLGYGLTNRWNVYGSVEYLFDSFMNSEKGKDGLGQFDLGVAYRYWTGNTLGDVYFDYATSMDDDVLHDYNTLTLGTKIGKRRTKYTVAAKAEFRYVDDKTENENYNQFAFGVEGMYTINNTWSVNGTLEYNFMDDQYGKETDNPLYFKPQVNVNAAGGTLSVYYKTDLMGDYEEAMGAKYGIQF